MARRPQQPPLVVHIIHELGTGGLENGLVNIINRSPPGRYRHAIVCLTRAGEFATRISAPDVQVIELHKRPGHDFGLYWRLLRALRMLRPAIVHTRNLSTLEMQFVAAVLPGVKHVHGEHGRDVFDLDGSNRKYNLLRKAARLVVQRYIAVSKDLEQWLIGTVGVPPGKVRQIYNGVDQNKFHPRSGARSDVAPPGFLADDSLVVGTVGRLAEVKNQASLLRAVHQVLQQHPELDARLRVIIVGDGPMAASIRQAVIDLGLEPHVWLAGDRHDIPELLQSMDVFALPSLGEGISNTVLEATASGLPVIATDVGGNPELVQDGFNGLLVPVGDDAALADAITDLVIDADRRETMGANAAGKVRAAFDWRRTVAEYLSVYDELIGGVAPQTDREDIPHA
jgi:sugar transferase (PEP-CTERM/EpsH1 system associated)